MAVIRVLKKVISKPKRLGQFKTNEFKNPELVPSNSKILYLFFSNLIAFAIIWDSSIFNISKPNKKLLNLPIKIIEKMIKKISI